jgi:hypothetical protein
MIIGMVRRVEPIGSGRLTGLQRLRFWGNWLNLSTPAGLLVGRLGGGRVKRGARGLYLADGYRFGFPIATAFTIGSVVITRGTWDQRLAANPNLLRHEERHTWQYLVCFGLPFFPLYALALLWSYATTRDIARGNVFERTAGLADGGYV